MRKVRRFGQVSLSVTGMPAAAGELGREQVSHPECFCRAYVLSGGVGFRLDGRPRLSENTGSGTAGAQMAERTSSGQPGEAGQRRVTQARSGCMSPIHRLYRQLRVPQLPSDAEGHHAGLHESRQGCPASRQRRHRTLDVQLGQQRAEVSCGPR